MASSTMHHLAFLSLSLSLILLQGVTSFALVVKSPSPPTSSLATSSHSISDLINGPNTVVVGEADLAFRQGMQLEKSGQPRKANSAFHKAAMLYQSFLDDEEFFGDVTSLSRQECPAVLAYSMLRLGFLSMDALGDPKAAIRLYTLATMLDPTPSAVSFEGKGKALEAAGGNGQDLEHLKAAVVAYSHALDRSGKPHTAFCMAVALERLGSKEASDKIMATLQRSEAPISCLVDSWGYVREHTRKVPPAQLNLHRGTRDMLKLALDAAMPLIEQGGLVCEFGVSSGRSMRLTQEILPLNTPIYGFDTFTGLPQAWGEEPAGSYTTGGIVPNMEGSVYFQKGLFSNTIAPFLEEKGKDAFLAYANVDCDLYTSTLDILEGFQGRIAKGTILIFDEYICYGSWRQDEFRAWRECCKRFGWKYEYLGFSLATKQTVVRVTDV